MIDFKKKMNRIKKLIPLTFMPAVISPFPNNWSIPNNICDWVEIIFQLVITIGAIMAVILFLIGGIQYLVAAGNEEATSKAKRLLLDAIIGLVLVLAAWAFASFLITYLGANYKQSCSGGGPGSYNSTNSPSNPTTYPPYDSNNTTSNNQATYPPYNSSNNTNNNNPYGVNSMPTTPPSDANYTPWPIFY
jgi:hypothetical protein